jgi:hypothetical protein
LSDFERPIPGFLRLSDQRAYCFGNYLGVWIIITGLKPFVTCKFSQKSPTSYYLQCNPCSAIALYSCVDCYAENCSDCSFSGSISPSGCHFSCYYPAAVTLPGPGWFEVRGRILAPNATVGHGATVVSGATHVPALCTEHQKSGASNTPPPAAATVDSIMRYLGGGLYIYQSTNIYAEY